MKDHNVMTEEECRDELARIAGYEPCPAPSEQWHFHGFATRDHPIPATLDEAAKLPDWCRANVEHRLGGAVCVVGTPPEFETDATKMRGVPVLMGFCMRHEAPSAIDRERLARFRLRVAVTRAERGER